MAQGSDGDITWSTIYDSGSDDQGLSICTDSTDNIIVVGTLSNGSDNDFYTIKYDSDGNLIWAMTYDTGFENVPYGVVTDASKGIIIAGYTLNVNGNHDYCIIKYDSNGNLIWARTYDSGQEDYAWGVAADSFNNVIVTGWCRLHPGSDYHTIKYDPDGNVIWTKEYDNGDIDRARGIVTDSGNNIIVTGYSSEIDTSYDYYTIKYDSNANVLWARRYDIWERDLAWNVTVDHSDNVIVTGYYRNHSYENDYCTIKYDKNGNFIWAKYFDSGNEDLAYDVSTDSFNNVIVTGSSNNGNNYDYYTIKYDKNGNIIWVKTFDNGADNNSYGITTDSFNNYIVTGTIHNGSNNDIYTIKYEGITSIISLLEASPGSVAIGDSINVSMIVENISDLNVSDIVPSVLVTDGNGSVVLNSGPSPAHENIAAHTQIKFTWIYSANSAGTLTFNGNASGDRGISSRLTESNRVVVYIPNTAPTISDIPNQQTNEDTPLGPVSFTISDAETPADNLQISASSSNHALVADANISLGGSGENRTITITPLANQHGSATVTVTVSDGIASSSDGFTLTVNSSNDLPIAIDDSATVYEDSTDNEIDVLQNDLDPENDQLKIISLSDPANGTATIINEGKSIYYSPDPDFTGTDSFTYVISDGNNGEANATITVNVTNVNDGPSVVEKFDEEGVKSRDISVPYSLIDNDSNPCSITVQYYELGVWKNATLGQGGEGTLNLSSSPAGVDHLFVWDSKEDIKQKHYNIVKLRIKANDGTLDSPWTETDYFIIKNKPVDIGQIFNTLVVYRLNKVNELLFRINGLYPDGFPGDIQQKIILAQQHIDNANSTESPVKSAYELMEAINILEEIIEFSD